MEPKEPHPLAEKVDQGSHPDVFRLEPGSGEYTYGEGGHPNEPISYFSINGKSFPIDPAVAGEEG
ncbi:MAG: hypothetical protein U5K56_18105 [Halioglobus sp.]|nr:hypothetical protein [Halioglobus sp.]